MKIGLLLPNSKYYPYIGSDLYLSLKHFLGENFRYSIKDTGFGSPRENQVAVKELVLYESVDLLVGYLGYSSITAIKPLIQQTKTPLILCSPGDHPYIKADKSPYIVHLSLDLFQSYYFSCKWAFENIGKKYSYIGSFFEAGYPFLFAAELAAKKFGGYFGNIAITHKEKDAAIEQGFQRISQSHNDFILMGYHGTEAAEMINFMNSNHPVEQIPVVVPPFFYESEILKENKNIPFVAVKTWQEPSKCLMDLFNAEHNRNASVFAILGNEAASVIKHCIDSGWDKKGEISPLLENYILDSERGSMKFDIELNRFICNYNLFNVNYDTKTSQIVDTILHTEQSDFEVLDNIDQEISGWTNTYLCN